MALNKLKNSTMANVRIEKFRSSKCKKTRDLNCPKSQVDKIIKKWCEVIMNNNQFCQVWDHCARIGKKSKGHHINIGLQSPLV